MSELFDNSNNEYVYVEDSRSNFTNAGSGPDNTGSEKQRKHKQKKAKDNKAKNSKLSRAAKKVAGITVSAAAFGLIAGGTFNYIAGDTIKEFREELADSDDSPFEELFEEISELQAKTILNQNNEVIQTTSVGTGELNVSAIVKEVMPSIVSIDTTATQQLNQGFFGTYEYEASGSGSGIIIAENDTELLIVTNNHVVDGANTMKVGFADGESYDAKLKSTDSDKDLAIIVVDLDSISSDTLSEIKLAKLGSSDDMEVGEQVVAIGNALGYGQSVTTGILSAKDRDTSTNSLGLLQTDAAINPGNSGGALLNMKGEVIGINSAKYEATDVEGMGYAIPISNVEDILGSLMSQKTREKVSKDEMGYLGIVCGTVTQEMQFYYDAPAGVYVSEVTKGGGADRAGLPEDCIITEFDGKKVTSTDELTGYLEYYRAGEKVKVKYSLMVGTKEYEEKTIDITLGEKSNQ